MKYLLMLLMLIPSLSFAHEMSPTYTTDGKTICVADDKPTTLTGWPAGVPAEKPITGYKEVKAGVVIDWSTGLKWQKDTPKRTDWVSAVSYCDNLNYSGYYDWRLPTYDELNTLVNKNYMPTINPIFENTVSRSYWSISRAGTGARQVNFNGSRSYIYRLGVKLQVRCVR